MRAGRNETLSFDEKWRQKVVPRPPSKLSDACRRGVGRVVLPDPQNEKPDRGKRSIELLLSSSLSISIVNFSTVESNSSRLFFSSFLLFLTRNDRVVLSPCEAQLLRIFFISR